MQQLSKSSRSPYGERGLKYVGAGARGRPSCRSPYGERGLKCRRGGPDRGEQVALLTESVD